MRLFCLWAMMSLLIACAPMRATEPGERPLHRTTVTSEGAIEQIASPESALDAYLTDVIAWNPGLRATWMDYQASLQRVPQVTSLSDPMLTATLGIEELQTRTGEQDFALGIQQRFPWFDVLDLRGKVAAIQAQEMLTRHRAQMLDLTREAERLWWEMAFQRTADQIAAREADLLEGYAEIARSRYATGRGTQRDVLRAEVEISRVEESRIRIAERLESLTAQANALADRSLDQSLGVPGLDDVAIQQPTLSREALIASAEQIRPEIMGLQHERERRLNERTLADRTNRPEMMIGANWVAVGEVPIAGANPPDEGDDVFTVTGGVTIPLWRSAQRAALQEADHRVEATELRLADTRNRVAREVTVAMNGLEETADLIDLHDSVLIHQAEQTLAATEAAFANGRATMLDLIDAERVLLRLQLARAMAARDHMFALADLERALGAALPTDTQELTQ